MSFIEIPGLGDIQEQRIADGDQEYELIVTSMDPYTKLSNSERGEFDYSGPDVVGRNIQLTIAFDGQPDLQPFRHWLVFPLETDDDDTVKRKVRRLRRNVELMGIPFDANGIDMEEIVGVAFVGRVVKETMSDREGAEMTEDDGSPRFVNRLLVPRFKG